MRQETFVARRAASWAAVEALLNGRKAAFRAQAARFPELFRQLSQDLNAARAAAYDPALVERLERLVLSCHQRLYGARSWSPRGLWLFVARDFPRALRANWRSFLAASILFYGLAGFAAALIVARPDAVSDFMSMSQARDLEGMYDPQADHFLKPRGASGDADMFGYYIYNNVSIAFRTFAGGALGGFGSFLFLSFNGMFLGAVAGHLINAGFASTFFPFVLAHGAFELTAIVISAQAGFILGWRLFVTRGLTRSASLREGGRRALPLIAGAALFLVVAAVIEAFWSSRHEFPLALRLASGGLCWLFVALYLGLAGRGGSEQRP